MDRATRERVRQRAGHRCEYCRIPQGLEPYYRYQVEHIIARQHGGSDEEENLALACPFCNQHKGPNIAGRDPLDDTLTPLFNPRQHDWEEHFTLFGPEIFGLTAIGRATVRILNINDSKRMELRAALGEQSTE